MQNFLLKQLVGLCTRSAFQAQRQTGVFRGLKVKPKEKQVCKCAKDRQQEVLQVNNIPVKRKDKAQELNVLKRGKTQPAK